MREDLSVREYFVERGDPERDVEREREKERRR